MENRILAKQFKNAIVSDLSCLNGTQFEDLCKAIFSLVLNREVLHKGCNLNGKPVPYAVDVKTEDCKIVGQSGTDVDYFTKSDFVKPKKNFAERTSKEKQRQTAPTIKLGQRCAKPLRNLEVPCPKISL